MVVLPLVVWGLSVPTPTTYQLTLPVIPSPALPQAIIVCLFLCLRELEPGCRLICCWRAVVSTFRPVYLPDCLLLGFSCAVRARLPSRYPQKLPGKGAHRTAWGLCLLTSFNWKNSLYTFDVCAHFEKGSFKKDD